MIARSLDPDARWEWTPPGQDLLPPERRAVCSCRYPVVRQYLRISQLRTDSIAAKGDDGYVDKLREALAIVVVSVTIGGTKTDGPDALLDVATPLVLWDWVVQLAEACQAAESDLGKSESPSRTGAERSARVAVAAGVNGVDRA